HEPRANNDQRSAEHNGCKQTGTAEYYDGESQPINNQPERENRQVHPSLEPLVLAGTRDGVFGEPSPRPRPSEEYQGQHAQNEKPARDEHEGNPAIPGRDPDIEDQGGAEQGD